MCCLGVLIENLTADDLLLMVSVACAIEHCLLANVHNTQTLKSSQLDPGFHAQFHQSTATLTLKRVARFCTDIVFDAYCLFSL